MKTLWIPIKSISHTDPSCNILCNTINDGDRKRFMTVLEHKGFLKSSNGLAEIMKYPRVNWASYGCRFFKPSRSVGVQDSFPLTRRASDRKKK